jgi:hypothetical protein
MSATEYRAQFDAVVTFANGEACAPRASASTFPVQMSVRKRPPGSSSPH